MTLDPFVVLGVGRDADATELAAARRRLAMAAHPDVGGSVEAMQAVNDAYDRAMSMRRQEGPVNGPADAAPTVRPDVPPSNGSHRVRGARSDMPSFTIDVLPAEAHEALLVVTSWMGEVLVDDPPYLLEVFLRDPAPCWCRLDLVPDAGATTVSLLVAGVDGDPTPDPEDVRDVWVANLNRLGDLP